ncbi:MAG TPA: outer membrane beta-barrel protein [Steroidobacteraceae bacterium]|jgi:hypothetical protein
MVVFKRHDSRRGIATCLAAGAAIAGCGGLTASGAAHADDIGVYLGGSLGAAQQNYDPDVYSVHGSETGYKFALGIRPLPIVAAEASYIDFGRAFNGINYADTHAVGVFALGFLPIPVVDVYGKVGVADWRISAQGPFFQGFRRTGADLAYGAGAGTHWGSFGARLEYERYEISHSNDMGMASLGLTWTFL